MKLGQARDLLASETSLRKKAEADRDQIAAKWDLVRELIRWAGAFKNSNAYIAIVMHITLE